jgi:hypothetical protein
LRTLVVSDLHLGATSGADLLRREDLRACLVGALGHGDRLVILGDGLELREVPVRAAAEEARHLLAEVATAVGPEGEIVMSAGNHDHGLVAPWIDARLQQEDPPPLGLAEEIEPRESGPLATALAEAAMPARLRLAYPGFFVRDDVYAIHGHYLDIHTTVPTFERLAAGAMTRWASPLPEHGATPDDYEAALAPLYAWMLALTQRQRDGLVRTGSSHSARAWVTLRKGPRSLSGAVLGAGFAGAVGALNLIGMGPLRRDISGAGLRQGSLHGIGEALRRLGVTVPHVLFGHSHRSGPWPGDDLSEWLAPTGSRLMNTGSWVYQRHFLSDAPNRSPYWPGTAILVEDTGPPQLIRLLGDRDHSDLAPRPA